MYYLYRGCGSHCLALRAIAVVAAGVVLGGNAPQTFGHASVVVHMAHFRLD